MEIATSAGTARAELDGDGAGARFLLVLTHGSGGGTESPDVLAVRDSGLELGGLVARVTQPYRVRGGRAPGPAGRQDAAWAEIVAALAGLVPGVPLVQGGRSNGARVACRTAGEVGARAVIALAFPLCPPRRRAEPDPPRRRAVPDPPRRRAVPDPPRRRAEPDAASTAMRDRLAELHAARAGGASVLVLNGERDPFGIPGPQDADRVVVVPGETHALKGHRAVIAGAVARWLPAVLWPTADSGVKAEAGTTMR